MNIWIIGIPNLLWHISIISTNSYTKTSTFRIGINRLQFGFDLYCIYILHFKLGCLSKTLTDVFFLLPDKSAHGYLAANTLVSVFAIFFLFFFPSLTFLFQFTNSSSWIKGFMIQASSNAMSAPHKHNR